MADRFVDDGGNNSDGLTWAKAYTSVQALQTAESTFMTTSGNRVIIGADSNCTDASAALTLVGPTAGLPVIFISSTVSGTADITYSKGTGNQILATGGTSDLLLNGSFALFGIKTVCGRQLQLAADNDKVFRADDCLFVIGSASSVLGNEIANLLLFTHCEFDFSATTSGSATTCFAFRGNVEMINCVASNLTNRTGALFGSSNQTCLLVSGLDMSSGPETLELLSGGSSYDVSTLTNIQAPTSFAGIIASAYSRPGKYLATNCGPADAPSMVASGDIGGNLISTAAIYRSGGGSVEGGNAAWLITTTAVCSEEVPFFTPWIYGTVGTTGSKTFDVYITNDTGDFTDAQVWLQVEYLKDADEALWTLATDHRATITTTAAAQTDDTTSTWNGTGPNFTYKQRLSVTATIGETGQYRARVAVGVASIASSRYFYIDPDVTVT